MKNYFYFASFLLFLFSLGGWTCSGGKNRTDSQWTRDMAQQNPVKAQEGSAEGEMLMKAPPEGTRARNRRYYPYKGDPLKAGEKLKNPLENTREVLTKGQNFYEKFCIYCHGTYGDAGEGASVAPKMIIKPASLLTDKAKSYSDGRLYHIIYEGQGLMGAYRIQLETEEQVLMSHYMKEGEEETYKGSPNIWSVVHYVRSLQKNPEEKGEYEK